MSTKSFCVIGLGRFGTTIAQTVAELGHEVLGVDIDEEVVQKASPYLTHVAVLDVTDEDALAELGVSNFDVVIVAIGDNLQSNLLSVMLLKDMGVKYLVAKAQTSIQGRMLSKMGVDDIVYPEQDMAIRIAHSLTRDHVLDFFQLSDQISLVEMETPKFLIGRTLIESRLREDYNVSVIAVRRGETLIAPPNPMIPLKEDDVLIIVGKNDDVNRLDRLE